MVSKRYEYSKVIKVERREYSESQENNKKIHFSDLMI